MKRQATYKPPFNCWRLPSVKDKNKKARKKRQPTAVTTTTLAESINPLVSKDAGSTNADSQKAPVTSQIAQSQAAIALAHRLPISPVYASSDPFGSLTGEGDATLENIGRWWFYRHADQAVAAQYDAASVYWVDSIWDLARNDEIIFTCVIAFSSSKMARLTGVDNQRTDLLTKGRILELVLQRLHKSPEAVSDGLIFVAMTCLALMEMRDGDFPTALKHLLAIQRLVQIERVTGRQWLCMVFVDLRFSLMLGKTPLLPYYIPEEFRATAIECLPHRTEAHKLALRNVRALSVSPHTSLHVIFANFRKLHELTLAWEELMASPIPPFGQVYDLDYNSLTSHVALSKMKAIVGETSTLTDELVLGAIQLHVWILSRFWVPQKRITYAHVLRRINALLAKHSHNLLDQWYSKAEDLSGLVWILFTFTGLAHEFTQDLEPLGVQLLAEIAVRLGFKREIDLTRILQKWPWVARWHGSKSMTVWALVSARLNSDSPHQQCEKHPIDVLPIRVASPTASSSGHYYIGGFEFCAG